MPALSLDVLVPALLTLARLLPALLLLSLLSRGWVPLTAALGVACALAVGLQGQGHLPPQLVNADGWLLVAVARELCVGLVFALLSALPLLAVFWSARVAERQLHGEWSVPLARLYVLAAALLTLALGGHRAWLRVFAGSLRDLPLAGGLAERGAFLSELGKLVGEALTAAVALGLPLWMSVWLLDLTLSLVQRWREHEEPVARAPLRAGLSLLLVSLLLAPLVSRTPEYVRAALERAPQVLRNVRR